MDVIVLSLHSFSPPQWTIALKGRSTRMRVLIVRTSFLLVAHVGNAKDGAKWTIHLSLVDIAAGANSTATTL
jgi:hypothetical protein